MFTLVKGTSLSNVLFLYFYFGLTPSKVLKMVYNLANTYIEQVHHISHFRSLQKS